MKNDSLSKPGSRTRETKSANPLPNSEMLPGAVCAQFVSKRGKLYGPYWSRFWREGGRLRKAYVKRSEVEAVRIACDRHRLHVEGKREAKRRLAQSRRALAILLRLAGL